MQSMMIKAMTLLSESSTTVNYVNTINRRVKLNKLSLIKKHYNYIIAIDSIEKYTLITALHHSKLDD